jgi:hypothetical protein
MLRGLWTVPTRSAEWPRTPCLEAVTRFSAPTGAAGADLAGGAQRLGHQRGCPAGRPRVPAAQPRGGDHRGGGVGGDRGHQRGEPAQQHRVSADLGVPEPRALLGLATKPAGRGGGVPKLPTINPARRRPGIRSKPVNRVPAEHAVTDDELLALMAVRATQMRGERSGRTRRRRTPRRVPPGRWTATGPGSGHRRHPRRRRAPSVLRPCTPPVRGRIRDLYANLCRVARPRVRGYGDGPDDPPAPGAAAERASAGCSRPTRSPAPCGVPQVGLSLRPAGIGSKA